MPFHIVRNDITKMEVDAIVNTANPHVQIGGGVDTAINLAAGPGLILERECIGDIPRGEARLCRGHDLQAKFVIQTVGPWWDEGESGEREVLANCYRNSLALAAENDCESMAFPLISAGSYQFPKEEALSIAVAEITKFLLTHEMTVFLVVYNKKAFALAKQITGDVQAFIDCSHLNHRIGGIPFCQMAPDKHHGGAGGCPKQNRPGQITARKILRDELFENHEEKQPRDAEHGKRLDEPVGHPGDE